MGKQEPFRLLLLGLYPHLLNNLYMMVKRFIAVVGAATAFGLVRYLLNRSDIRQFIRTYFHNVGNVLTTRAIDLLVNVTEIVHIEDMLVRCRDWRLSGSNMSSVDVLVPPSSYQVMGMNDLSSSDGFYPPDVVQFRDAQPPQPPPRTNRRNVQRERSFE